MKAARLEDDTSFSFGETEDLFTEWIARNKIAANYDFDAKSQRLVVVKPVQAESVPIRINVVLNWFTELANLPPAR
jgi:hypothetical protein